MKAPIEVLKAEHRVIEKALCALDGLCDCIERGGDVPAAALDELASFISTFADRFHHAKEEAHLFPALERHGLPAQGGPIAVMLHEHESGRRMAASLRLASEDYAKGDRKAADSFARTGRSFSEHLRSHIHKEDNILFMIADSVLDAGAMTSVTAGFQAAETEFGPGFRDKYEELAARLERDWGK